MSEYMSSIDSCCLRHWDVHRDSTAYTVRNLNLCHSCVLTIEATKITGNQTKVIQTNALHQAQIYCILKWAPYQYWSKQQDQTLSNRIERKNDTLRIRIVLSNPFCTTLKNKQHESTKYTDMKNGPHEFGIMRQDVEKAATGLLLPWTQQYCL